MPLTFAYGTNMDVDAMRRRCPASRPVGRARLARHRLAVTAEGCFTVVRDPRAEVHGLLFDLALADVPALDRYEEVGRGLYAKVVQPVLRAGRRPGACAGLRGPHAGHRGGARGSPRRRPSRRGGGGALPPRYIAGLDRFEAPSTRAIRP